MTNRFESLKVFQEAHSFVLIVYKISSGFPKTETFGLTSQIRRAAVSVIANIIEGNTRSHKKELIQFLYLAKGSLEEVKYYLILTKDLNYISSDEYNILQEKAEIVGKMLAGLIKYWKTKT